MGLLSWIFVGLVAGLIAKFVVGGGFGGLGLRGIVLTIILGIGGALLGGYISSAMGWGDVTGFNVQSLVIASLGAMAVVAIWNLVSRRRSGNVFA